MLPPALGGLRTRVPPIPGQDAPGSISKIMSQWGGRPIETPLLYQKPPAVDWESLGQRISDMVADSMDLSSKKGMIPTQEIPLLSV